MASTFNFVRNSRAWFSTNVNASSGVLNTSAASMTTANTLELTILDGFSFSQSTQQQTIQLSEAGVSPNRGQRAFNTALDPVEFSFSTYIRPYFSTDVKAEESVLWNALFGSRAIDAGTAITISSLTRASTTAAAAVLTVSPAVNLSSAGIALGDVINIGSFVAGTTAAGEWAGPVTLDSITGSLTAATVLNVTYLTPPTAAATAAGIAGAAKIFSSPWYVQGTAVSQAAFAEVNTGMSNKNQLQKFGMYFLVDNAVYAIDNCVLDSASIDFALDDIATVTWAGKGTALKYLPSASVSSATSAVFSGTGIATGTAGPKATIAPSNYITNKLSTMSLQGQIMGGGTSYNVAITGGNLTIANNISYLVPANIGVVNTPIGYFTGTRAISGNVTAYLRTGSNNTAQILSDILTANNAETKFRMQIEVGGASNAVHADFEMNGVVLQVPTVETGDVMTTTINFSAQGYDPSLTGANGTYDLSQTNDLIVRYYAT
jgi:hypothetical protein